MIKKIFQPYRNYRQRGFMMPAVLIISSALFLIGLAGLDLAQATFTETYTELYSRLAQEAAKAGVDFAKDKYEADQAEPFTAYSSPASKAACLALANGQKVNSTNGYCAAFGLTATATTDGTRRIKSVGTIFANNRTYTRTLTGILNRKTTAAGTPDQFSPLIWLDANDSTTINLPEKHVTISSVSQVRNETLADGSYITNNTIGALGYYSASTVYTGISFKVASLPANATIKGAYIKMTNSNNRDVSDTNPLVESIQATTETSSVDVNCLWLGNTTTKNNVGGATGLAHTVNWDVTAQPFGANAAGSNFYQTIDVTSLAQDSLGQGTWGGASDCMSFRLKWISGSGNRAFQKPTPQLYIIYETSPVHSPPASGGFTANVLDKSGNNNYFTSNIGPGDTGYANPKWYTAIAGLNSHNILSFANPSGAAGAALGSNLAIFGGGPLRAASQKTGQTVFIVGEPRSNTRTCASSCTFNDQVAQGTFASTFANGQTGNPGGTSVLFGARGGVTNTPNNICIVTFGTPALTSCQTTTWSSANNNSLTKLMVFQSADNTGLRQINNQNGVNASNLGTPTTNYNTFSYDTYYSLGTNAQYGGYASLEGTLGEFILYDKVLTCPDIKTISKYLSTKWNISIGSDVQCQGDVFF